MKQEIFVTQAQQEALTRTRIDINSDVGSMVLVGSSGRGKTLILDALADKYDTRVYTKTEISSMVTTKGYQAIQELSQISYLILDDIESNVSINAFGTKFGNIYEEIIRNKLDMMAAGSIHYQKKINELTYLMERSYEAVGHMNRLGYDTHIQSCRESILKWEHVIKQKLFMSSNDDVEKNFDERTCDRIKTAIKICNVDGESLRENINTN